MVDVNQEFEAELGRLQPRAAISGFAAWALANIGPEAGEAVKPRLREKLRAVNIARPDSIEVQTNATLVGQRHFGPTGPKN